MGSLVVRASDSRPEGLGSMPDTTKYPPSTHGAELAIQERIPIFEKEKIENFIKDKTRLEAELRTSYGEIALISCPILTCKIHYPQGNNPNDKNNKPKSDPNPKNLNSKTNDRVKKNKRSGSKELQLPKKATRTIKGIPIEQIVCTPKNKFAALEVEENPSMEETIQPGSIDDHRDITPLLEDKKAEHYVIDHLANQPIKVVIKGLPVDTDMADIEADLVQKRFAIEKVAQLRKFSTKAFLPIYMVGVRRTEMAQNIYDVKNVCYLCVTVDPFQRKPGVTQCYNCNYFNHSSKNCKMNPRCLKCGKNHRRGECEIKEKIENPKYINCNEDGHVASLRSCSVFPKIKPQKGDANPTNNKTQNKVNTLPKTRPVEANVSFPSVCDGKINQKMAPQGITASHDQESYHPK
ncbi:nucleic-acid-binding protein from transposon X-element [Trichonephila clavipes]|nr:nucleic-acid-binding protein from transposon X-element [Trichonephila clavipes]